MLLGGVRGAAGARGAAGGARAVAVSGTPGRVRSWLRPKVRLVLCTYLLCLVWKFDVDEIIRE